ncbi:hypothetical protein RRG08_021281 [Elysia crispata]|uniref:Uncharacterized protein n=1 Tax=Elysia crispata TaxID=231223 RepID=A0AAE1DCP8_9GAST|nr:hypothetical protein RRG08_021281 [Elysia crispata]
MAIATKAPIQLRPYIWPGPVIFFFSCAAFSNSSRGVHFRAASRNRIRSGDSLRVLSEASTRHWERGS